jgi:hypothetical protein
MWLRTRVTVSHICAGSKQTSSATNTVQTVTTWDKAKSNTDQKKKYVWLGGGEATTVQVIKLSL